MAYTKQNFTDNNILYATQLEKMEDAIIENENKVGNIKSPTKVSELENDAKYLSSYTETDPTVPAWAKAAKKPSYTASEVGADPAGTAANLLKSYTETDPTVPSWAKAATKPSYTAGEVGADLAGTAAKAVGEHNVDPDSHNDIRIFLTELSNRLNAVANSDDVTLDQMAEVVAYIKDNRSLIDQITTGKINVSDIVNNLTTNVSNKPLSAAQGVALKNLVDAAANAAAGAKSAADSAASGATEAKSATAKNASDIETMQRSIAAIVLAYEETADKVYKITPRIVGERLVIGGGGT